MLPRAAPHLSQPTVSTTDKNQHIKPTTKHYTLCFLAGGPTRFRAGKLNGTHPVGHCQGKGIKDVVCNASPFSKQAARHSLVAVLPDQG